MSTRVGLVLAGGGARGAYEAGALSVLLPALEARGERPSVLVGTSVGAINAAYLAASHHLGADDAVAGLLEHWRATTLSTVVRPILRAQLPVHAARLLARLFASPGGAPPSLLDPTPIAATLRAWNDWPALRRNVGRGSPHAVAVVATEARSGRTVVFCDSAAPLPDHRSHVVDYVRTELGVEHVRASAAIPLLFPAVRVEHPAGAAGWYVDGGARLNTPIKPALDLGVDRLAVVATATVQPPSRPAERDDVEPPDLWDGALNMLHGNLIDPLIEDVRMLGNVNTYFSDGAPGPGDYRGARGKPPYREVPYLFVGPRRAGAIGELAGEVFRSHYTGFRAWRSPDLALLHGVLGAGSPAHSELFSYLFFAPEFIDALITMGAEDARAWLDSPPGPHRPWQTEPLDAFVVTRPSAASRSRHPPGSTPRRTPEPDRSGPGG